jgi:hypothetical protein
VEYFYFFVYNNGTPLVFSGLISLLSIIILHPPSSDL